MVRGLSINIKLCCQQLKGRLHLTLRKKRKISLFLSHMRLIKKNLFFCGIFKTYTSITFQMITIPIRNQFSEWSTLLKQRHKKQVYYFGFVVTLRFRLTRSDNSFQFILSGCVANVVHKYYMYIQIGANATCFNFYTAHIKYNQSVQLATFTE